MKRGMLGSRRESVGTAVSQTTQQADRPLHRVGKLGLAVRVPGRRLPKSTIQQLIKH